jgi:hypothetical protein
MDITAGFGPAVPGSSPGGRTAKRSARSKQTALLASGLESRSDAAKGGREAGSRVLSEFARLVTRDRALAGAHDTG